jgi:hypothetical protein
VEHVSFDAGKRALLEQSMDIFLPIVPHERDDTNQVQEFLDAKPYPERERNGFGIAICRADQVSGRFEQSVC